MSAAKLSPMKWLAVVLGVLVVLLQYRLWLSDDGVRQLAHMREVVAQQEQQNAALADRNRQLAAEVRDLKTGMTAIEERARSELGMIGANETYYQVVPGPRGPGGQVIPDPRGPGGQVVPGPGAKAASGSQAVTGPQVTDAPAVAASSAPTRTAAR